MPPKEKIWLQPRHTGRMMLAYEKERLNNIKRNQLRLDTLVQNKIRFSKNQNFNVNVRDDDEYRLPDGEEDLSSSSGDDVSDDNNEYSNPQMEKVMHAW